MRHRGSTSAVGWTLKLDLGPDLLFHPLQGGSVDDHRAEPARRKLTPCSENELHVMVGGVAMLTREPRSQPARAGIVFQLLHGRAGNPPQVAPTPTGWREDDLVNRQLPASELP